MIDAARSLAEAHHPRACRRISFLNDAYANALADPGKTGQFVMIAVA
jgi:hypothetical protein